MSDADNNDARIEKCKAKLAQGFQGEEDLEGASTPQKDLVAAVVIALFSVMATIIVLRMPNPGNAYTAPGLLLSIIGFSLLLIAIGVAVRALREGGANGIGSIFSNAAETDSEAENWIRIGILIVLLVALVVLLDVVTFELSLPVAGFELRIGSFECMTIPVLTAILRLFWRGSVLRCFVLASIAVLALATAFRYGFTIPLPGTD